MHEKKKKPFFLNITKRLIFFIFIILIIAFVVFSGVVYAITKIKLENDKTEKIHEIGELSTGLVISFAESKNDYADILLDTPDLNAFLNSVKVIDNQTTVKSSQYYDGVQNALDTLCTQYDDVVSAWLIPNDSGLVIANDGNFISADEYNLHERSWYRTFMISKTFSHVYYHTSLEHSIIDNTADVITVISAVYENEMPIGYCGVELKIDGLKSVIGRYSAANGSHTVIMAESGNAVYAPTWSTDYIGSYNKFSPIINQSSLYADGYDSFITDDDTKIDFYVNNSAINGWSIIVCFDDFTANNELTSIMIRLLIILLCLIVLAYIFIIDLIKKQTKVLDSIQNSLEIIECGETADPINVKKKHTLYPIVQSVSKINDSIKAKNDYINKFNNTDTLTGLPNRIKLYEYLEDMIAVYDANPIRFAIMFVDIDNFKWLNETLGHNFGDAVICKFGEVLKDCIGDSGKVFRFSGDEFIVVVEFNDDYDKLQNITYKLQNVFNHSIKVMTDNIYIKFSVGIAIFPDDDITADLLMRDADIALHRSKENGKDRVSYYINATQKTSLSKAAISQRLTKALKNNELYLNYQPIVSTTTGDIYGFEVLLRWDSPEFGFVPPTEFINVAEESGTIIQIGTWIFESACRFLKELNERYSKNLVISINVSPVQLKRADYMEHIKRVIEITQVNPASIQIEITESTMIDFVDSQNSIIEQIDELGISIALDDFGTGYSSLNYLKNFPIKCLKIDKSFVDEINKNKRDYAITDSIIDLVHNLGIKTVAEGIETVEQYNFLTEMKCDYIQGFLMSKPLKDEDALQFVELYDALHKPDKDKLIMNEKQLASERDNTQICEPHNSILQDIELS